MPRLRNLPIWLLALIVPVVAAVAVVVTLTTTSDGSASGGPGTTAADTIVIQNFAYTPSKLVVAVGTAVKVENADGTAHTVTARDKSFDTGHVEGSGTATITIDKPGTYQYFCDIHNYMTGTIEAR